MSHDEIESIFNVIHVDYVGEEELKEEEKKRKKR